MNNPPLTVNKQQLKFPLIQDYLNRALNNWAQSSKHLQLYQKDFHLLQLFPLLVQREVIVSSNYTKQYITSNIC